MFKCRLADLNICYEDDLSSLQYRIGHFQHDFERPDLIIPVSRKDIELERKLDNGENITQSDEYFEEYAAFRKLGDRLPEYDAVVMHSCLVDVYGTGVAFTARSGTGKTTHMLLWKQTLNDKMTIVNGDKPLVRFVDNDLYAYGSPWAGKERLFTNDRVPLRHICKIERSETNITVPMSKEEGIVLLMQQVYMPKDKTMLSKTLEIINRIADNVKFWTIYCNMEIEAAQTAQKAIFSDVTVSLVNAMDDNEAYSDLNVFEDNSCVAHGYWMPKEDTNTFILSNLSFKPKRFIIYCNDVVLSHPKNDAGYFITYNIDMCADGILAAGCINTSQGAKTFALSRSNKLCTKIAFTNNGLSLTPLTMAGFHFYFAAGKRYSWTVMG